MALIKISEPGATSQTEERENETVVGIDLGTTNSLIAIIENPKGSDPFRARITPAEDSSKKGSDPFVRFFADENGRDIHPSIVEFEGKKISSIKRFMNVGFTEIEGLKLAPAQVSAAILQYLKNIAETRLKSEIKKAVITVPAYFDETAKNATKLAANLAGLEVLRLVNEPTAAALAYGLDNAAEGIYCVYDLGGGTFDVSILKMQKGVFKVLGVSGDNQLGGDDFDDLVAQKLGVTRAEGRKIKEQLSLNSTIKWTPQQVRGDTLEISTQEVSPRTCCGVQKIFTRQDFEKLIAEKITRTISLTTNLIDDLELESVDIKGVILVGGSTRIPLIKEKLSEI